MAEDTGRPVRRDVEVVTAQLGRDPRGAWRVGVRCRFGYPQVIVTAPSLGAIEPFPTLYWLTCPFLTREAGALESDGGVAQWAEALASDAALAGRQTAADAAYRDARAREAGGVDPCGGVGVAGQRDPLATKCLHAHAAAFLAGIDDPAGEHVIGQTGDACEDAECSRRVAEEE